jgi:imidazole glycerol-phosphate synthase subunit HisF
MLRPRITPCLLVHKGGLVKTVGFATPKYVGDPVNAVKIFNEKESDELIVVDIDASRNGVEPNYRLIGQVAVECRMPLCYGGGITTAAQARRIIALGVEKVSISAGAVERPDVIREIASEVGSQSVVVVLDVRAGARGYEVWTHNGTRTAGRGMEDMAAAAESMGAGELLVNSIDRDGSMKGYDLDMARRVRAATSLPMTILGGAGSLDDISALIGACGVIGASAGSLFVFKGQYRAVLISYPNQERKDEIIRRGLAVHQTMAAR